MKKKKLSIHLKLENQKKDAVLPAGSWMNPKPDRESIQSRT